MKRCPACKRNRRESSFHKNRAAPDGLQWHCIDCRRKIDKRPAKRAQDLARWKTRYREQRHLFKDRDLRKTYGISLEQFDALWKTQNGKCAMCDFKFKRHEGSVDHDHQTGKVRGILCRRCNLVLGFAKDDPVRLDNGAAYLRKHA